MDWNQKQIDASDGLLAPINGSEAFLSVGAEHWAGGIRAAKFGCRTDQVTIADTEGKISVSALSKDKEFKSLLEDGWDLEVFPAECE